MRDYSYYTSPQFVQTLALASKGNFSTPYFETLCQLDIGLMLRSVAVLSNTHFTEVEAALDREGKLSSQNKDKTAAVLNIVRAWRQRSAPSTADMQSTGDPDAVKKFMNWYDDGLWCSKRAWIFWLAYGEFLNYGPKIRAAQPSGLMENNKPLRQGWEELLKYHELAYGNKGGSGKFFKDDIKFYRPGVKVAGMENWCGIFAVAVLKMAKIQSVNNWMTGGQTWRNRLRSIDPVKEAPKVGDVGYLHSPHQHHFLVAEVSDDGKSVKTIDGNSGGEEISTITYKNKWKPRGHPTANGYYSAFFNGSPDGTGDV